MPPLRQRYKLCYGVGHLQNDLTAAMWFSYTLVYLEEVVGLSTQSAGALLLLGQARPGGAQSHAGCDAGACRSWLPPLVQHG